MTTNGRECALESQTRLRYACRVLDRRETLMLDRGSFITDGGLETTLIFHGGFELPFFAAFVLLESDEGRSALEDYFRTYRGDRS